jgi:hypothetical protein
MEAVGRVYSERIPRSRVILEKMISAELINEIPRPL